MKKVMDGRTVVFFVFMLTASFSFAVTGSVKTTATACASPVNQNAYFAGDTISIYGDNLVTGSGIPFSITGVSGCDDKSVIVSGHITLNGNGTCSIDDYSGNLGSTPTCIYGAGAAGHQFCFQAYIVQGDDCGVYKFAVDSKTDNYSVTAPTPTPGPSPEGPSLTVTKTGHASGNNLVYTVTLHNAGGAATTSSDDVNAWLVDGLPDDTSFVSASGSNWECDDVDGDLYCTYNSSIPAGGNSSQLTITLSPSPVPATRTCYTNVACASLSATEDSPFDLDSPVACDNADVCIGTTPALAVPAVTDWGMILFVFLAGMASIFYLRKRKKNI